MNIVIGNREVGLDRPPYFIADIAANHDGDLKRALHLIELAKECGADAAKFQNFRAARIVSRNGFSALGGKRSHQANWKKSVYEIYEDASISWEWTPRLKEKCAAVGIEYFSSPYDLESVNHLEPYVNVYKIGSGDISWPEILSHVAAKGKPVMLATGASTLEDVRAAMATILAVNKRVVLMQCNTNYTADPVNFTYLNLNVLKTYAKLFPEAVLGLSDHTPGHSAVVAAVALGARVFEKHFTDDCGREGPDHRFSMTPHGWKDMVRCAVEAYYSLGDGDKRIEDNERDTAVVQRRGLFYARDLKRGQVLCRDDLQALRPRLPGGVDPVELSQLVGRKLVRDVQADEWVKKEDLNDAAG